MKDGFKIHCIALCKNEVDVVALCLNEATKWADYIYVYDGGSTDGTWEAVKKISNPKIIAWKQDGKVFKEGLRAEVFNEFRHLSEEGDWWFQLNVDEFYPESPRKFLARVPVGEDFVWGIMVEYVITDKDMETIDFSLPFDRVMGKLRYYYVAWSEPRAFRYRKKLVWHDNCAWPHHVGVVAVERILYKHYPCRSPQQIKSRWSTRKINRERGFEGWVEADETRRTNIKSAKDFVYDDGKSPLKYDETTFNCHLEPWPWRMAKKILYGLGIWP